MTVEMVKVGKCYVCGKEATKAVAVAGSRTEWLCSNCMSGLVVELSNELSYQTHARLLERMKHYCKVQG